MKVAATTLTAPSNFRAAVLYSFLNQQQPKPPIFQINEITHLKNPPQASLRSMRYASGCLLVQRERQVLLEA